MTTPAPNPQQENIQHALAETLRLMKRVTLIQARATTTEAFMRYISANTQLQGAYNNIQLGSELETHGDEQQKERGA